jgi:hypothetical protein
MEDYPKILNLRIQNNLNSIVTNQLININFFSLSLSEEFTQIVLNQVFLLLFLKKISVPWYFH